ncbi:MAG: agmatine deiminase family protein [Deltaproteobacteria bacterium]|nr:agmatine deiminase family protein [Deltaproteobacteria bacterium]
MPAEFEPHAATWLSWPHNEQSWPGKIEKIPPIWAEMVHHLTRTGEFVHINVTGEAMAAGVASLLSESGVPQDMYLLHPFPTNDAWCRDHGPIFVRNDRTGEIAVTDWEFNKWGGKYPPWDLDNAIPGRIAQRFRLRHFKPGIVLEGGSIDVNGRGTLITTAQCLLNPNRNPHLQQKDIERYLTDYLGADHFIWLHDGIEGDDTDGHVDDITRFVDPKTIVTAVEPDPASPNHEPLQKNLETLRLARDKDGSPFRIVELPMPERMVYEDTPLPASYANFYIGNRVVLVPTFGQPRDEQALAVLRGCFPGREVIGIYSYDLVWGFGAFHCVSQQQPA